MFASRQEAGRLLGEKIAEELPDYMSAIDNRFVIGISRGGILVAGPVSRKLKSPLSIFEAETMVDVERPTKELAVVSSGGLVIYNDKFKYGQGEQGYIGYQVKELAQKARESQKTVLSRAGLAIQPQLSGKRIIIVDEGINSDMMRQAAALTVRNRGAKEVILAAPVICRSSKEKLQGAYDELVALETPSRSRDCRRNLYHDCRKIDDTDVIQTLIQSAIFLQPQEMSWSS